MSNEQHLVVLVEGLLGLGVGMVVSVGRNTLVGVDGVTAGAD